MTNSSFRQLNVYKEAKKFTIIAYAALKYLPSEEKFAMADQLRRSASSVMYNIAEGVGRISYKEQLRFIEIAFGSLNEALSQMDLALELKYIDDNLYGQADAQYTIVASLLSGLRRSIKNKIDD